MPLHVKQEPADTIIGGLQLQSASRYPSQIKATLADKPLVVLQDLSYVITDINGRVMHSDRVLLRYDRHRVSPVMIQLCPICTDQRHELVFQIRSNFMFVWISQFGELRRAHSELRIDRTIRDVCQQHRVRPGVGHNKPYPRFSFLFANRSLYVAVWVLGFDPGGNRTCQLFRPTCRFDNHGTRLERRDKLHLSRNVCFRLWRR